MEQENFHSIELEHVQINLSKASSEQLDDSLHSLTCAFSNQEFTLHSLTCAFSNQEFNKLDLEKRSKTTFKLSGLIFFYTIVMVIEIIGGFKSNSLAVLSDASHLLSDIIGFAVSVFSVWVSGWEANRQQSFGFNRLEVLGALLSVQLIWLISGTLVYEAINRLIHKTRDINGELMFGIATFGFVVNFFLVLWLGHDHSPHHGHSHHSCEEEHHHHKQEEEEEEESTNLVSSPREILNINIQGAYLHLITDLIQSAGVMIAGCVIWLKPKWLVVDLICTIIFSVIALSTTLPMLKNIFCILMERAPSEIDMAHLENGLKSITGVQDLHDLHVWAISVGKNVMVCHVTIEPGVSPKEILHMIRDYCKINFGIHHVTVEIEQEL